MIPRGLANRYATALFRAALKKDIADRVVEDGRGFRQILLESPKYKSFLLSPQVLTKDKQDIIHKVLDGRATDLFIRFLLLLVDKKRIPVVDEIIQAYIAIYERHVGIAEARIITAVPIDGETEKKVIRKLEQDTQKKIRINQEVDPDIIGGMIIILDDLIIDGSVRHQLDTMRKNVEELRVY